MTTLTNSESTTEVESLLQLIASSAQDALSEYKKAGKGIPSLDTAHPLDSSRPEPALKKIIRTLEGACEQLCSTLAHPGHTMGNVSVANITLLDSI
jgi:hypothetical protein